MKDVVGCMFCSRQPPVHSLWVFTRLCVVCPPLPRLQVEAKTPEDIYKTHLTGAAERGAGAAAAVSVLGSPCLPALATRASPAPLLRSRALPLPRSLAPTPFPATFFPRSLPPAQPESAKSNLASTYVNAWVNAGFGADKLVSPVDSQWVFRNRDSGQMAAAASLGLVCAWDETRLDALDKYLNAEEEPVRAGASECARQQLQRLQRQRRQQRRRRRVLSGVHSDTWGGAVLPPGGRAACPLHTLTCAPCPCFFRASLPCLPSPLCSPRPRPHDHGHPQPGRRPHAGAAVHAH